MSSEEETIACPYDSAHQVLKKHFQKHILQCQLNHPDSDLRKCPFNVTHLVRDAEFDIHVKFCTEKTVMTNYKNETAIPTQTLPVSEQPKNDAEENWDEDEYETYDPQKNVSSAPIMQSNIVRLPSTK